MYWIIGGVFALFLAFGIAFGCNRTNATIDDSTTVDSTVVVDTVCDSTIDTAVIDSIVE